MPAISALSESYEMLICIMLDAVGNVRVKGNLPQQDQLKPDKIKKPPFRGKLNYIVETRVNVNKKKIKIAH